MHSVKSLSPRVGRVKVVARILIVSDAKHVRDEVRSVLADGDTVFIDVERGNQIATVAREYKPSIAVVDMQIASMGGIAVCMAMRLEESGGRLPHIPVLLLLDRRPDVFLARRARAEGWLLKPLDAIRIRRAVSALLAGERFEDDTYEPDPVLVGENNSAADQ